MTVTTGIDRRKLTQFKPGQSGNPAGRPKGSRNKLSESFLDALYQSFQKHGAAAIEQVIKEKPDRYLAIIAATLPRDLNIKTERLEDMSDTEILEALDIIRAMLARDVAPRSEVDPLVLEPNKA